MVLRRMAISPKSLPKKIGMIIKPTIGIGDSLQFSSLPENYYRTFGRKLIDISKPWFFDHNPFVDRDSIPNETIELWNFPSKWPWPMPRNVPEKGDHSHRKEPEVYLSNAEVWASALKAKVFLNKPRIYRFEDFPYEKRDIIIFQTEGRSHGILPNHIIEHVIKKYGISNRLVHIGPGPSGYYGLIHIETPGLWDLAELISKARMFIGPDSGPSWISSCFPDIITKIVRTKPNPPDLFENWIPLQISNVHSFWDDRCRMTYNISEQDIGFTWSFKRL